MVDNALDTPTQTAPFHAFAFTYVSGRNPRAFLRLEECGEGLFELHVEKGPASRPSSQFTRKIPIDTVAKLADALRRVGVFGWEESYEGASDVRWNLRIVFKEDVFTLISKGTGSTPDGFDELLEALYGIDFPRHDSSAQAGRISSGVAAGVRGGGLSGAPGMRMSNMSAGDLGAYSAVGGFSDVLSRLGADPSLIEGALEGLGGMDGADLTRMAAQASSNPRMFQQQMKDEFKRMSADEQNQLLDALAAMGVASRSWWERFLRG